MTRNKVVKEVLGERAFALVRDAGSAFAPANIALCKYWGKRNEELNLPVTSSLSISLGGKGTRTEIRPREDRDFFSINGKPIDLDSPAASRMAAYLDLFRSTPTSRFEVATESNIPIAAGLASSASVFASVVLALDDLYGWGLDPRGLSLLARLGSGSACRSVHRGFAEWHVGAREDGMDSYAEALDTVWPEFRLGLVTVSEAEKPIGSRPAMKRTRDTSQLYESWPLQVADDLMTLKEAIREKDFEPTGRTAEENALAMHATMIASRPAILYWLPESVEAMRRVWALRAEGLPLYLTMDAGPNIKLLFLAEHTEAVEASFAGVEVVSPFEGGGRNIEH